MGPRMENCRVEITRLLEAWTEGDNHALDALTPLVHKELRRLAHRRSPVKCSLPANEAILPFEIGRSVTEAFISLSECIASPRRANRPITITPEDAR